MNRLWSVALLALAVTTAACRPAPEPLYQEQLLALGALVDISLWGVEPGLAAQAGDQLSADFNRIHRTWHAWQDSALTRINAQLSSASVASVEPELIPLLRRARELSRASGGLFNPAIGRLVAAWGFHSDEPHGPPPQASILAQLVAQQARMDDVQIEGNTLRSSNPAVQLDFGAIGQGYAVDVAIERLRKLGVQNAIVNASGDIRVIGRRGTRPWRIGIRDPRRAGVIASLEMQGDESIVTSGTYERYYDYQGKRYHHIIDARSGYPARAALSVTVLHRDATTADAASTALLVAGPQAWHKVARAMGIKQVMLIDNAGTVHIDPLLAKRLRFETPVPTVKLSKPL